MLTYEIITVPREHEIILKQKAVPMRFLSLWTALHPPRQPQRPAAAHVHFTRDQIIL